MDDLISNEKIKYKYYLPKSDSSSNETYVFDMDFYINTLKRYNVDIIQEKNYPFYESVVDYQYILNMRTTKEIVIQQYLKRGKSDDYLTLKMDGKYVFDNFIDNTPLFFNTNNGNDIISAPRKTKNNFDIYNGVKRFSGGINEDFFNLYTTESPQYASRFYGREGNDTLRIHNTTAKTCGYIANLSENYIRFTDSQKISNSQNFYSKLYLYHYEGNVEIKKIEDSMADIKLQDETIIAYLDSIENIIGSRNETHFDNFIGNEQNNYLDGGRGVDFLYGLAGNDTLILEEGYAEGGDGLDTYIVSIPLEDKENKFSEIRINEKNEQESSLVKLGYDFSSIKTIIRNGNNLHIYIENEFPSHNLINHKIVLINFYQDKISTKLGHEYSIIMNDGFFLLGNQNQNEQSDFIFNFSYLKEYDNNKNINYLSIDESKGEINFSREDTINKIKIISTLKYSGLLTDNDIILKIKGNDQNNNYFSILNGYSITLSSGNDNYYLKTFLTQRNKKNKKITFLIENKLITTNSMTTIHLPDISGFDLVYKSGIIWQRYNPKHYLNLRFNHNSLLKILNKKFILQFIDKDHRTFILSAKKDQQSLLTPTLSLNISISNDDDVLMIPNSLVLNKEAMTFYGIYSVAMSLLPLSKCLNSNIKGMNLLPIIELLGGDDKVVNANNVCSVIDGGEGDDTLVVNHGHHILIAGKGNDNLSGGSGNDILISDFGHDYLSGGKGSNVYLIQKRHANVTVYDEGRNSQIIITGIIEKEILTELTLDNEIQYRTKDNQFVLTLKTKEAQISSPITVIQKQTILNDEKLANIIYEMAKFNEIQLSSMQGSEYSASLTWSPHSIIMSQL